MSLRPWRWLLGLLCAMPVLATPDLAGEVAVLDGWPVSPESGGPTGLPWPGQLRRVELILTNHGDEPLILQSVQPEAGLTTWLEAPFDSVTRRGDQATIDFDGQGQRHGGSLLTQLVWPGEGCRVLVAARPVDGRLKFGVRCLPASRSDLARRLYVLEPPAEEKGGTVVAAPAIYRRRTIQWLEAERPVGGLWFGHDLDIVDGQPVGAGEGAAAAVPRDDWLIWPIDLPVETLARPPGIPVEAVYSNALGGWVARLENRPAEWCGPPARRLAVLSAEALDVLDAGSGPWAIRLGPDGAPDPAGLPAGVVAASAGGWQVLRIAPGRLANGLAWLGGAGRRIVVQDPYFAARPLAALP